MSTYPDTATLAAFRRTVSHSVCTIAGPWIRWAPLDGGAWPDELQHGIGWLLNSSQDQPMRPWSIRREASSLRSRAYAVMHRVLAYGACTFCGRNDVHYQDCPTVEQYQTA